MKELAQRAVACKRWRWMAGMGIWIGGEIVKRCVVVGAQGPAYRDDYGRLTVVQFALPDLNDPATVGCLLTLVRDAHRDAYAYASFHDDGWGVFDWGDLLIAEGPSEQEALVAALEAAP